MVGRCSSANRSRPRSLTHITFAETRRHPTGNEVVSKEEEEWTSDSLSGPADSSRRPHSYRTATNLICDNRLIPDDGGCHSCLNPPSTDKLWVSMDYGSVKAEC